MMKTTLSLLALSVASASAWAGTTLTCVGARLLLVETVGDSGIAVPGRNGTLYFRDQLIEKHRGNFGDLEVRWESISVRRQRKALIHQSKGPGDTSVTVTRDEITLARLDGHPLLEGDENTVVETALCSEVREFRPIP